MSKKWDAVVVGSGPNGLAAAITLAKAGFSVVVYERASTPGGGMRSEALTLPGYTHDVCSAAHPLAIASPFFSSLPLANHGLTWVYSKYPVAHPLDDGTAAWIDSSVETTAEQFSIDRKAYLSLMKPLVKDWNDLKEELLGPILHFPSHPFRLARFGAQALLSANFLAQLKFQGPKARALFGGIAAHASVRLDSVASAAVGLVLQTAAHTGGWPIPLGGSQKIADALVSFFKAQGGEVILNTPINSLDQLPESRWVFLDLTPKEILKIAQKAFPSSYSGQLKRFRYGAGVFKLDWALSGPIPWLAEACTRASTVHLGATLDEIAYSEEEVSHGRVSRRPFVLLVQPSLFDSTRAPAGKHTAWAYCHVPNGYKENVADLIEAQIERFAPGFRSLVLARSEFSPKQLELRNPNLVGGDISGGMSNFRQLLFRPAVRLNTYSTPNPRIYICSSSTPPGPGVHGMSGYNAAMTALGE